MIGPERTGLAATARMRVGAAAQARRLARVCPVGDRNEEPAEAPLDFAAAQTAGRAGSVADVRASSGAEGRASVADVRASSAAAARTDFARDPVALAPRDPADPQVPGIGAAGN
jgi:hypothetical protein